MSERPAHSPFDPLMMDAGPCITFCAVSQQGMLLEVLSFRFALMVPHEVDDEILRMRGNRGSGTDFSNVEANWRKLTSNGHVTVLDSSVEGPFQQSLDRHVRELTGQSMAERKLNSRDIGEIMAIAHALVLRERGHETVLLIEDGRGQELATENGLRIVDTVTVLRWAAMMGKISNRDDMRRLYTRMQPHDAALIPLEATGLMDKTLWRSIQKRLSETSKPEPKQ